MFSKKLIFNVLHIPTKYTVKTYRKSVKTKFAIKCRNEIKGNPGGNRLLAMTLEGESPDKVDISMEEIEGGENDMLNSHLFYDEYIKEKEKEKNLKSFYNIKRKYFKIQSTLPNFLTYLEKQQIKFLHNKTPKEWTPETLSLCFPATPEIIQKILKSKWIADEGIKIIRHDKLVQHNWESFRSGTLQYSLPEDIKHHLSKFSDRRPKLITLEEAEKFIPRPASDYLKPKEFGQIITSYLGEPVVNNDQKQLESNTESLLRIYENDLNTDTKKKHFILEELNIKSIKKNSCYNSQTENFVNNKLNHPLVETNFQESTMIISKKEASHLINNMTEYPLAIRIPKNVWKEGFTYKVNDCFYDDNGDFLYRVPGLKKN
ncbi:uncharacterized protein LOC126902401 [Daktulosphaira vitifoliae]|uniref:uncharacterized protein LOC126902401 n=1 Tax=Daktulosphaira vitifoliae TaxID=58002 RepID=UPI0021AA53E5|nr:uncharacterized protein LOC126902401 [Daktulosphaira vitifoliae]